jgi:hypothetical protein
MRKLLILLTIASSCYAQNARKDDVAYQQITQTTSFGTTSYITSVPGATITVGLGNGSCAITNTPSGSTATCTPLASLCSSSSDTACLVTNPFNADSLGNYGFWAKPARYSVAITGIGVLGKVITYDMLTGGRDGGNADLPYFLSDNIAIQPTSAVTLPSLNFFDFTGTARWAVGNKDCGGSVTNDLVYCSFSSNPIGQISVFRINSATGGFFSVPGLQIFNTTTTCTTGASVGSTCTTANITLPVAEIDTNYRPICSGIGNGVTNVPVVVYATVVSNTQFTITIATLTASAASFSSYTCFVGHN